MPLLNFSLKGNIWRQKLLLPLLGHLATVIGGFSLLHGVGASLARSRK